MNLQITLHQTIIKYTIITYKMWDLKNIYIYNKIIIFGQHLKIIHSQKLLSRHIS